MIGLPEKKKSVWIANDGDHWLKLKMSCTGSNSAAPSTFRE